MVVKIHFQSDKDLQWLEKILEMLKNAAVHFEVQGVGQSGQSDLRKRRSDFLKTVRSGRLITTKIEMPDREERNAR